MSKRVPLSTIGQLVPELPVEDVERAQQYYRDVLGFEIGWLYPGKEMGGCLTARCRDLLSQDEAALRTSGSLGLR